MKFTAKNLDDRTGRGGPLPSEEHPAISGPKCTRDLAAKKKGQNFPMFSCLPRAGKSCHWFNTFNTGDSLGNCGSSTLKQPA